MDDDNPQLSVWSCVVGGAWILLAVVGTVVVPRFRTFREMFEEMGVVGGLPTLTRIVVAPPAFAWIALGLTVAGFLVGKSLFLSPRDSDFIDKVSFVLLLLAGAGVVIGLFLPLIRLQQALAS